ADRRRVVAGKLITFGDGIHHACLLRDFSSGSITTTSICRNAEDFITRISFLLTLAPKKLPDRSEPWASGIRQANLFHLLSKIMCDSLPSSIISNTGRKPSVREGRLFDDAEMTWFRFAERVTAD